jgi:urease accessory protein
MKDNTVPNNPVTQGKSAWLASLELDFDLVSGSSRLKTVKRLGPLSVQKAFYPQGPQCAHVYLLHPPAGIVSGDELHLIARLDKGAQVLITTPGASRFYRARDDLSIGDPQQSQISTFHLDPQTRLEYLPQETLIYDGAEAFNQVDVYLQADSIYSGWEITCLGLPASGQPFVRGQFTQLSRIFCDEQLIYHDRITINAHNNLLHHPAGLAGNTVFGNFVLYPGNLTSGQRHELLEQIRILIIKLESENYLSVTDINGLLVIRYLGLQAQQCKLLFIEIWQQVRLYCDGNTVQQPRIWFT